MLPAHTLASWDQINPLRFLSETTGLLIKLTLLAKTQFAPSRKSDVKSCFLCTRRLVWRIYSKSAIRTKVFYRLFWRRPGSETNMHDGLLRHSKVQSKVSYTVIVPVRGTFRKWYSSFTKTSWRRSGWCVACNSIIIKMKTNSFDSTKTANNSRNKSVNFEQKNSNKNLTVWYLVKLENNCANSSKLTILRLPLEPWESWNFAPAAEFYTFFVDKRFFGYF